MGWNTASLPPLEPVDGLHEQNTCPQRIPYRAALNFMYLARNVQLLTHPCPLNDFFAAAASIRRGKDNKQLQCLIHGRRKRNS